MANYTYTILPTIIIIMIMIIIIKFSIALVYIIIHNIVTCSLTLYNSNSLGQFLDHQNNLTSII